MSNAAAQPSPPPSSDSAPNRSPNRATDARAIGEKILCPHCKRTATNGIKCKGICITENDY